MPRKHPDCEIDYYLGPNAVRVSCRFGSILIIYFDPVTVGVAEVDLPDTIRTLLNFSGIPRPVLEGQVQRMEIIDKGLHIGDAEADVVVLVYGDGLPGSLNEVHTELVADVEPRMQAVLERLFNFLKPEYCFIEICTLFQIADIDRDMRYFGLSRHRMFAGQDEGPNKKQEQNIFHDE